MTLKWRWEGLPIYDDDDEEDDDAGDAPAIAGPGAAV
jgi:hypothetical protein